ncbi:MAG: hypothetical protein IJA35_02175 [Clostridia bacterium]|nr:hypothetical protein [Clostridia bacterium]
MKKCSKIFLPLYSFGIIAIFAVILIVPQSRELFKTLSADHTYIMGFIKFALLATSGELIGVRIKQKAWIPPAKLFLRFIIWGVIGVWITFMMKLFSLGVSGMMDVGLLPGKGSIFLSALYTSVIMNTSFGPVFMFLHKCSDLCLESMAKREHKSIMEIIKSVDLKGFFGFTIAKTVPIFWIPAHTITFLLPSEYQVIMAAALSVVLGVILSFKK